MRLGEPTVAEMFGETAGELQGRAGTPVLLARMRELAGCCSRGAHAPARWRVGASARRLPHGARAAGEGAGGMMAFHAVRIAEVTPPQYDSLVDHETVGSSELNRSRGRAGNRGVIRLTISSSTVFCQRHVCGACGSFLVGRERQACSCPQSPRRQVLGRHQRIAGARHPPGDEGRMPFAPFS